VVEQEVADEEEGYDEELEDCFVLLLVLGVYHLAELLFDG